MRLHPTRNQLDRTLQQYRAGMATLARSTSALRGPEAARLVENILGLLSDLRHVVVHDPGIDAELCGQQLDIPEPLHFLTFAAPRDVVEVVQMALNRAEQMRMQLGGPGGSRSQCLGLICLDFLATNEFGNKGDPKAMAQYLGKLEMVLGMKLVGIVGDEVVHGLATLAKLAHGT